MQQKSKILKESLLISFLLSLLISSVTIAAIGTGLTAAYAASITNNGSFSTKMMLQDPTSNPFTGGCTQYQQIVFLTTNAQNGYAIVAVVQVYPMNIFWNGWVELWSAYVGTTGTIYLQTEIGQAQIPTFQIGSSYTANVSGYDLNGVISITALGQNIGAASFNSGSVVEIYATPGLPISFTGAVPSSSTSTSAGSSSTTTTVIAGQQSNITFPGGLTLSQQKLIEYALIGVAFLFLLIIVVAIAKR